MTCVDIEFNAIHVSVKDRKTGKQKTLINNATGRALSGRLLAILGSSGAGKSTLLDVLSGNNHSSTGFHVDGTLQASANGRTLTSRQFVAMSCYVQQKDILLCSATVREAITTSALLKLPFDMPRSKKMERVEQVIRELQLQDCADTVIGDEVLGLKGISGGQKRRVSVGCELIKDPSVVFLDEVTSGLDSETAAGVMEVLLGLARSGRTVVTTIHQPNSDITALFDDLMLLSSGHVVYGGPWLHAVPFFSQAGFTCPQFRNPTDYFMSVMRDRGSSETLWTQYEKQSLNLWQQSRDSRAALRSQSTVKESPTSSPGNSLCGRSTHGDGDDAVLVITDGQAAQGGQAEVAGVHDHHDSKYDAARTAAAAAASVSGDVELAQQVQQLQPQRSSQLNSIVPYGAVHSLQDAGRNGNNVGLVIGTGELKDMEGGGNGSTAQQASAPSWYQAYVLTQRKLRDWLRNPTMLASELLQYVVIGLFIGMMYFQSFTDDVADGVNNRISCIWFAFTVMSFTPTFTTVTNWDKERVLLKRELHQKLYNVNTYYLSRTVVMIPFQAVQCLLFVSIMYFFSGYQPDAAKFFTFFLALLIFQLVSEGISVLCAVVTKTATFAVVILTFVLLLILSFSGFLVSKIPVYFRWVNKASYLTYAFAALANNEFSGLTLYTAEGQAVDGLSVIPHSVKNQFSVWENMGILAAWWVGMQCVVVAALHIAYRTGVL